jgi:anti-anti-sigma factor
MSQPPYRHLRARTEQGVLVVTIIESNVHGDALAERLRAEVLEAVANAGATKVVMDLQFMKFISSAGFRPFLSLRRKLQEEGGRLVLCNLSGAVAEAFQITRLVSTSRSTGAAFEVQPNVAAAVASLVQGDSPKPVSEVPQET